MAVARVWKSPVTTLLCKQPISFCPSTGVPRHSAGGVGTFVRTYVVRTYVVRIVYNAHARVMEAENSITLTIYSSEHVFIALR